EAELRRLEEQVVEVHAAAFKNTAKTKLVLPFHPTDIIDPGEIVSDERCLGVIPKTKKSVHADLLNRMCGGLKRDYRTETLDTGHRTGGTSAGFFTRIAKSKIIDKKRSEQVSLVNQVVLVSDL